MPPSKSAKVVPSSRRAQDVKGLARFRTSVFVLNSTGQLQGARVQATNGDIAEAYEHRETICVREGHDYVSD
jgi:hypothetical protein